MQIRLEAVTGGMALVLVKRATEEIRSTTESSTDADSDPQSLVEDSEQFAPSA